MIYLVIFIIGTKSFAWIFFLCCFCAFFSTKALREYFGFFQPSPLTVNDRTLKYLKLQMTLTILSLIREVSLRMYTFKTAIYRKTNIYVYYVRAPGLSPFGSSSFLSHCVTLSLSCLSRKSSDFMSHIYANLNTECIV